MPVNLDLAPAIAIAGVDLAPVAAGLKSDGSLDMLLLRLTSGSRTAGVFTKNTFCAAPVHVAKSHLQASHGAVRAMLINSGNANAGTGEPGIAMATQHCQFVAEQLALKPNEVLPYSTGVIGQLLPDDVMRSGITKAAGLLANSGANSDTHENTASSVETWAAASRSIMTTDTEPKLTSRQCTIAGKLVTVTGMAKGAGMIQPNMATMLAYLFTDAAVPQEDLQQALTRAVDLSFNAITVDSDTSTNDACMLSATAVGQSVNSTDADWTAFVATVSAVALDLAQAIIRDAEGATKFITVNVAGGKHSDDCKKVAYAIANSPLVKTALFASDANVGRLLMAIGKADVAGLDPSRIRVLLGDVCAFEAGGIAQGYTEAAGSAEVSKSDITINVELGAGTASASVYTSDLSHDYVSINADYRS